MSVLLCPKALGWGCLSSTPFHAHRGLQTLSTPPQFSTSHLLYWAQRDLPTKPKKPMTPYLVYLNEQRQTFPSGMKNSEFTKKVAQKWYSLSEGEKSRLVRDFNQRMAAYQKEMDQFTEKLTQDNLLDEYKLSLAKERAVKKAKREMKNAQAKLKRAQPVLTKPKKPLNAYNLFTTETYESTSGTARDAFKSIAKKWREMAESEKAKYQAQAEKLAEEYKVELAKWEASYLEEYNELKDDLNIKELKQKMRALKGPEK
ncbi:hypothetical protein TCAL_04550 [Tigriopus californicus]|uniref:HMG box domain-containing protein n=1 Tax=Tigriopus californicus TaxID=6832 RepID=A0A553PSA6_TIGCA|nr:transcription factor A, mitochondrial-like [Tigriopus californicus]TRY80566.1 hypothetical protein TCAL_04550 [Tigriopus californicus]|eukprot:TCALIF_04550-PA protein Name:"Similar to TFAM Transcription factor A, mitochondrial (Bos taurus)" AED:0.04 eAED:0.04 QI:0/-1/0/1/-1/1/1/0/257